MLDTNLIKEKANNMRMAALEAIHCAGSGHPGGSLSAADIVATLYFYKMRVDVANPRWAERDRFVLSKGHACPILYAALGEKGFFPKADLRNLRKLDCHLQGHPDMKNTPGLDMSTGSLGQGVSAAVGMAYAAKLDKLAYKVYCLLGCGECQEGQVWEAAMSAGHFKLDNLVAIVDNNHLQIDGTNECVMCNGDVGLKFKANGWHVIYVDGHDIEQIAKALDDADHQGKPVAIIAETVKGKGISFMENQVDWHGKAPSEAELAKALVELGGAK
ncbi:transketolase [Sporomusa sp.]|uniref:transketolase n=1 Tax=Sporomusa sp. TaxID=2078658 RepID=UPI002C9AA54F|nr:transketolase [Sporomusa sp.]HWR41915.1 transketolase [Sporomusa sp.]